MNSKQSINSPAERIITLATGITIIRIVLVPFVVMAVRMQDWGHVLCLFGIAALSDVLDGGIARLRNEQTYFGACLDPLADKLLLLSSFAALSSLEIPAYGVPGWFFWLVFCKELLFVGSIVMLHVRYGTIMICPTMVGKLTTVIQMFFVMVLVMSYFFTVPLGFLYQPFLFITSSMTIVSFFHYVMIWYKQQRHNSKGRVLA